MEVTALICPWQDNVPIQTRVALKLRLIIGQIHLQVPIMLGFYMLRISRQKTQTPVCHTLLK